MPAHFLAVGVIDVAGDADFAAFGLALAGEHLDELPLAVAGDAGDADDLAAADRQRNVVHRDRAGIVERVELVEFEPRGADLADARAAGWSILPRRSWCAPSRPA